MKTGPYKKNQESNFNENYIIRLVRNFRNHPEILAPSNTLFYDSDLIATKNTEPEWLAELKWVNRKLPMIFFNAIGKEKKGRIRY